MGDPIAAIRMKNRVVLGSSLKMQRIQIVTHTSSAISFLCPQNNGWAAAQQYCKWNGKYWILIAISSIANQHTTHTLGGNWKVSSASCGNGCNGYNNERGTRRRCIQLKCFHMIVTILPLLLGVYTVALDTLRSTFLIGCL